MKWASTAPAEGVEEEEQLKILQAIGCTYAQGYLFSPPLSVQEFEQEYLDYSSHMVSFLSRNKWQPPGAGAALILSYDDEGFQPGEAPIFPFAIQPGAVPEPPAAPGRFNHYFTIRILHLDLIAGNAELLQHFPRDLHAPCFVEHCKLLMGLNLLPQKGSAS